MDAPALLVLTIFGAFCVVFGYAMVPLWRRVRRTRLLRRETMMLSTARARERLLWVNAFGSIAIGAVLLGAMQVELYFLLQRREHDEVMASVERQCGPGLLVLRNRTDRDLRVTVSDPVLLEYEGYLGERPEVWKAQFERPGAYDLGPRGATHRRTPGRRELRFQSLTPGVCGAPSAAQVFETNLFVRRTSCTLEFELAIGEVHDRVSCRIK